MKRLFPTAALVLVALAGAAPAGPGPFLRDSAGRATMPAAIGDGASCRVAFRVVESRSPFVAGHRLGTVPLELVLEVERAEKSNALCARIRRAGDIRMEAVERQFPDFSLESGDKISGTVIYGEVSRGSQLVDGYRHLFVIEKAPSGQSGVFHGLTILE